MSEKLSIRPYARLLTMLGDQLIKNESIAIMELLKNSYDADASFAKVDFCGFTDNMDVTEDSSIIVEDDGNGMNDEILKKAWLNPATPIKYLGKKEKSFTKKGRIIQGEKGIGRFAVLKLGKRVEIITRRQKKDNNGEFIDASEDKEYVLIYDFTNYDDDFLEENGQRKELFIDDIKVELEEREPIELIERDISLGASIEKRKPYGTIIKISGIKSRLSVSKIIKLENDIVRMQPIVIDEDEAVEDQFRPYVNINGHPHYQAESNAEKVRTIIYDKYLFKIAGDFNPEMGQYDVNIIDRSKKNGNGKRIIRLDDPWIKGLKKYKDYFVGEERKLECGKFVFEFYIFDLDKKNQCDSQYVLDDDEKSVIRSHRIYLYRDNIRVMPYGDKEDDWLEIDVARGTESASNLFSNDQTVGFISITQKDNPNLKDKTNREGLIDEGNAFEDFRFANQLILRYFRSHDYNQYLLSKNRAVEERLAKNGTTLDLIEKERQKYKDNPEFQDSLNKISASYAQYKDKFEERINRTENMAAVGLAVQTGAHDARIEIIRTRDLLTGMLRSLSHINGEIGKEYIIQELKEIQKSISRIYKKLHSLQKLFPSVRNTSVSISVRDIVISAYELNRGSLEAEGVKCTIKESSGELIVYMTKASLMQVFINLFDNALYWLKTIKCDYEIVIEIDAKRKRVIFADNGPGIARTDYPYIFDAFYSGKGDDGSGLGLYISDKLMQRYGYKIYASAHDSKGETILNGACFILDFNTEEMNG